MMPLTVMSSRYHGGLYTPAVALALGLRRKDRKRPPPIDPKTRAIMRDPETGE